MFPESIVYPFVICQLNNICSSSTQGFRQELRAVLEQSESVAADNRCSQGKRVVSGQSCFKPYQPVLFKRGDNNINVTSKTLRTQVTCKLETFCRRAYFVSNSIAAGSQGGHYLLPLAIVVKVGDNYCAVFRTTGTSETRRCTRPPSLFFRGKAVPNTLRVLQVRLNGRGRLANNFFLSCIVVII